MESVATWDRMLLHEYLFRHLITHLHGSSKCSIPRCWTEVDQQVEAVQTCVNLEEYITVISRQQMSFGTTWLSNSLHKVTYKKTNTMVLNLLALLLVGSLGVSAAPSAGCGQSPGLESGPQTINVNGQERQYIIRVPEGYDSANPYRLVIAMHWWGGTMDDVASGSVEPGVWNYYGLERLAEESAIFVAPNGIDGNWYNEGGSDYAFIDEVNRAVEESLCVDTELRFTIGFSWGGSMSVALACRGGEFPVRAVTAIAAAGPFECKLGSIKKILQAPLY